MIDPSRLLAGLPERLRVELLQAFGEITNNYLERRWEPAELNGGKFSEVVYSIIDGALKGAFPARSNKPANMLTSCRSLENVPADPQRVGDRSLRILMPRLLPVLYEIRNNRGVGHVGGDVDANHMDAAAIHGMASWLLAELVRIFHNVPIEEAREVVDALSERKTPLIWKVENIKRVLKAGMTAKDQTLLLLHHSSGWVSARDLYSWIEYSTESSYRTKVLAPMHKSRLLEFDKQGLRAKISPVGISIVEALLSQGSGAPDGALKKKTARSTRRPRHRRVT
ncbi:hypothetical protein [Rhodoplanes elegans]|uniref:hypothetical protein n=1 Tax=Rhodoplanes elegans TaxID=29408 RepID=UPI0011B94807|nr:hypothetical protein [Rhodoplanes elegans]